MTKKTTGRLSGRLIYVATIVAILGVTGGVSMGAILSSTPVSQTASFYQGGSTGVNGYGTPTLSVSTSPGACTTGTLSGNSNAGTVTVVLSGWTGASNCTAGHFAELFTFSFSATISTQSNTLAVTTQVGSGAVQTNSETVTLGTGSSTAFTQTVDVYVDYGSIQPPNGGITVLDLVVQ